MVFLAGPIIYCIYAAFTNMALTGQEGTQFVGFDNFTRAFTDDAFWSSVGLTLIFTIVSAIIGQNVLGMLLALLMRSSLAVVRALTSAVVIGAWVLPEVVAAYLWQAVLGPDGSWNSITGFFHIPPQNWLYTTPILAVSIANIWRGTAFSMLVYSAALSEVPRDLEEAALVDGAGRLRLLVSVTIPAGPPHHRDQPDADHAADPVGVRTDLHHDQGRSEQQEHDPAAVRLQRGVRVLRPRLRHRDRAPAAADRRGLLGDLSAGAEQVGADPMSAVTEQAPTEAAHDCRVAPAAVIGCPAG